MVQLALPVVETFPLTDVTEDSKVTLSVSDDDDEMVQFGSPRVTDTEHPGSPLVQVAPAPHAVRLDCTAVGGTQISNTDPLP
jgi:hypothetical protein